MFRRIAVIVAAVGAMFGISAVVAPAANAAFTHIYSPAPTGLLRVCVGVESADAGVCAHL